VQIELHPCDVVPAAVFPFDALWGPKGRNRKGKRFLALTAATATAAAAATTPTAEDAAAAAASANDHFRGPGLNHGQTLSPNPLRPQYD
jgi:hypothetical protein